MNHDYDDIARFYNWLAGWTLASARRELARLAKESGARRVLDIGCGTGLQLCALAGLGLDAVGLDNSPAMLAVARKRVQALPEAWQNRIRLELAPDLNKAQLSGSFDVAIISLVLHESATDPLEILGAAWRLAAKVFLLDWGMPERNLEYPLHLLVHGIEGLAGRRHYTSYKGYLRRGALEGLVQRYLAQCRADGLAAAEVSTRRRLLLNMLLFMELERK